MASSFSSLVIDLSEGIHRIKCRYGHDDKNVRLVELIISTANGFLNMQTLKMI